MNKIEDEDTKRVFGKCYNDIVLAITLLASGHSLDDDLKCRINDHYSDILAALIEKTPIN